MVRPNRPHYWKRDARSRTPRRIAFIHVAEQNLMGCEAGSGTTVYGGNVSVSLWQRGIDSWHKLWADAYMPGTACGLWLYRLSKSGERVLLVGHNVLRGLKLSGLFSAIESREVVLTSHCLTDPPVILDIEIRGRRITVVDARNYFASGVPAGLSVSECLAWLAEHVIGLVNFIAENDLGNWQPTISGLASSAYRHKFMPCKLLVHGNKTTTELERAAYYGGRCEIFRVGKITSKTWVLDINSMYPYVMKAYPYPIELVSAGSACSVEQLRNIMARYCTIARVRIRSDDGEYPYRDSGQTLFACGTFTTVLCHPELDRAIANDDIVECYWYAIYAWGWPFGEYVEYFYAQRLLLQGSGNNLGAKICKGYLNTLYGKFGQKSGGWGRVAGISADEPYCEFYSRNQVTGALERYRSIGWIVERQCEREEYREAIPSIAATITSYAREHLRRLIDMIGWDHVYYCDTDSIHVDATAHAKLSSRGMLSETALGSLKVSGPYDSAEYRNVHDYHVGGRDTISAVKPDAEFIRDGIYRQTVEPRGAAILYQNAKDGIVTSSRTLVLHRWYGRRVQLPDGNTRPVRVGLDPDWTWVRPRRRRTLQGIMIAQASLDVLTQSSSRNTVVEHGQQALTDHVASPSPLPSTEPPAGGAQPTPIASSTNV